MKEFKQFLKEQREKEKVEVGDWIGLINGDFGQVYHASPTAIVYESYEKGGLVRESRSSINDTREKFQNVFEKNMRKYDQDNPSDLEKSESEEALKRIHENWQEVTQEKNKADGYENTVQSCIEEDLKKIEGVVSVERMKESSGFSGTSVDYSIVIEGQYDKIQKTKKRVEEGYHMDIRPVSIRSEISETIKSYRGNPVYIERPERLAENFYDNNVIKVSSVLDLSGYDIEKLKDQGVK